MDLFHFFYSMFSFIIVIVIVYHHLSSLIIYYHLLPIIMSYPCVAQVVNVLNYAVGSVGDPR
jgi:hypothetical protein